MLIGGVDIRAVPRELMTLIPQESCVFGGTLRENLALLAGDASDADLVHAAESVGAGGLLARLGGLDAHIERPALSSGERQLLALAGVYASAARVVVLDEATAQLDPAAEAVAEQAFAAGGGTLVVIAHRLTSAIRAERVLLLDGGRPAPGTHTELLATSPRYAELMRAWTGSRATI